MRKWKPFNPTKRYLAFVPPSHLVLMAEHGAPHPWNESPETVEAGLAWGRQKAWLLAWVRRTMHTRLTARERECIALHFFHGISYAEIGRCTGTTRSSCFRAAERGIRRLREAAEEEGLRPTLPPHLRR